MAHAIPTPLTQFSDEESLFFSTVRKFAEEVIAPQVRAMDEEQRFTDGLVEHLFDLGLMSIQIPEEMGGAGGSFFDAVLAIEAISMVDPAVAVLVDVHNTLVVNALRRWGTATQQQTWLPKLARENGRCLRIERGRLRLGRVCVADSRCGRLRRLSPQRAQALDLKCARGRLVHRLRHA